MNYLKVEGTSLIRHKKSGALINQDKNGLDEYMAKRKAMELQREEINKIKVEVKEIKNDLTEIKNLMLKLLEKGQNG
jgi:hypothetical protein